MGLLPWSFGFLLITSVLTWALIGRMSEELLVTQSLIQSIEHQSREITKKLSDEATKSYQELCAKMDIDSEEEDLESDVEEAASSKQTKHQRKRLSSKLHISALLSTIDEGQKTTQETIFRNLLNVLYGPLPLCVERGNNGPYIQGLFDDVFTKARDFQAVYRMTKASHMANIELTDGAASRQFILFLILKGGKGEIFPGAPCVIPSLLDYVTVGKRATCVSVYLAPVPVLFALFGDEDKVQEIILRRMQLYKQVTKKETTALSSSSSEEVDIIDKLSEEFKAQFEPSLLPGIGAEYIDFRISKTRPHT